MLQVLASPDYTGTIVAKLGFQTKILYLFFLLEITNTVLSSTDIVFRTVYKHDKTYSLVTEQGREPVHLYICVYIYMCSVCIYIYILYISGCRYKTAPSVRISLHVMKFYTSASDDLSFGDWFLDPSSWTWVCQGCLRQQEQEALPLREEMKVT